MMRWVAALYQVAVRIGFPREFLNLHYTPMMRVFEDAFDDARRQGSVVAMRFLVYAIAEAFREGWAERYQRRRTTRGRAGGPWFGLAGDLRLALRLLVKNPGFTLVAVVTLGVGIGANTALFSVVSSVLIQPLPFPNPDRLVRISGAKDGVVFGQVSLPDLRDIREAAQHFEHVGAWQVNAATLRGERPERVLIANIESRYLRALGVVAALGRVFHATDDVAGHSPVVVISTEFWRTHFSQDSGVVGRSIVLDDVAHEIVGVLPFTFADPFAPTIGVWIASPPYFHTAPRTGNWLYALARLVDGSTLEDGQRELDVLSARLEAAYPADNAGNYYVNQPLKDVLIGDDGQPILVMFGAVSLMLVVACANVANLLMSRATRREQELAVRLALGCERRMLARQLMVESLVLAGVGGLLGVVLAYGLFDTITTFGQSAIPRFGDVRFDVTALGFALVISVGSALLFGVVPAMMATRADPGAALRGSRGSVGGGLGRWRDAFVVSEIAGALILLAGATLFGRTLVDLMRVDTGMVTDNVLSFSIQPGNESYPTDEALSAFRHRVENELHAIPGVQHVGLMNTLPLVGATQTWGFWRNDVPRPDPSDQPSAQVRTVSGGLFQSLQIPIVRGRSFDERDGPTAMPVVVVNQTLVRHYYGDTDPLGLSLEIYDTAHEIVGVVADIRDATVAVPPRPVIYSFGDQQVSPRWTRTNLVVMVRLEGDPLAGSRAITDRIFQIDPNIPVVGMRTLNEVIQRSVSAPRFRSVLIGIFASVALLLSIIGVAGVIGYHVSYRVRELGLRLALGATPGNVTGMVLWHATKLTVIGSVLGAAGAFVFAKGVAGVVSGLAPFDVRTLILSVLVVSGMVILAAWVPARRAARIDPLIALGAG